LWSWKKSVKLIYILQDTEKPTKRPLLSDGSIDLDAFIDVSQSQPIEHFEEVPVADYDDDDDNDDEGTEPAANVSKRGHTSLDEARGNNTGLFSIL